MRKKSAENREQKVRSRKVAPPVILLLIAILLSSGWLSAHAQRVSAGAPETAPETALETGSNFQANPTPSPQSGNGNGTPGVSPVVGILVLLAPLIFLAWKSRGAKAPKITSSCCLPVIDEHKRPFQIWEDEPGSQTATKKENETN